MNGEAEDVGKGFIELRDVARIYHTGEVLVKAVDGMNFVIEQGELAIVVGPSGAGKSTVLNILGGMDTADKGEVFVDGVNIAGLDQRALTLYRRESVGFVFQFYNLIPNLTAYENVELAAQICSDHLDAAEVLERVGLEARLDNFPSQLSGGEQQRVAIARALAKNPKLLLCDEPTGALDSSTGKTVLELLQDASRIHGITVVIITHNQALKPMGDRVIQIRNGRAEGVALNPSPLPISSIDW
ncbi:MAG: ABC transporter ATP-binding protein [Coriobacteriia bacterium]|nr:ABC transporter ATP-binding protein [Coriobacteriia bacterium]MCL2751037.1 ABC transporter ATP-binding protein [Coriobacteriia bacterium]